MANETLNDMLRDLDKRGEPYVKVASGYYVGGIKTFLICNCDGNCVMQYHRCPTCEGVSWVCSNCLSKRNVEPCPHCASKLKRVSKLLNDLQTPIDFDQLIADGKLARISPTKYKLLVSIFDLPMHVIRQVASMEEIRKGGDVEQFIEFDDDANPAK